MIRQISVGIPTTQVLFHFQLGSQTHPTPVDGTVDAGIDGKSLRVLIEQFVNVRFCQVYACSVANPISSRDRRGTKSSAALCSLERPAAMGRNL